jgi:hypothetical protein
MACTAQAASVTWGTLTPTVNETSIDTNGILIYAGCWGTGGGTVALSTENITFNQAPQGKAYIDLLPAMLSGGNNYSDGNFWIPQGSTDPTFDTIMDGIGYGGKVVSLTVQNLIPGAQYEIQLFASDNRSCCNSRSQKWSDASTSGTGHETAAYIMNDSPYVIGSFTADATTQTVYAIGVVTANDADGNVDAVNGFVLRMITPPSTTTDTDGDGLSDSDEILVYGTSPSRADTDGDNLSDGQEVALNTDPLTKDSDSDGVGDGLEVAYGTDPLDPSVLPSSYDSITWGAPQNITGALSDFAVNGTRVLAWTGGWDPVTIAALNDGGSPLTFVSGPPIWDRYVGFDPYNRGLDPNYETLLDAASYSYQTEAILLPNLVVGHQYQVQIWYVDDRDCCAGRPGSFGTDPTTPAVTLSSGSKPSVSPVVPAQYVIGTFTAQHTIQPIFDGYTVGAQYNALMLRDITNSTPATDLRITDAKFDSGAFKVTVTGLTSTKNYKLTRSLDLATFTDVAGSTFTATSATQTVSDSAPPAGKAFYRVVLVP